MPRTKEMASMLYGGGNVSQLLCGGGGGEREDRTNSISPSHWGQ